MLILQIFLMVFYVSRKGSGPWKYISSLARQNLNIWKDKRMCFTQIPSNKFISVIQIYAGSL